MQQPTATSYHERLTVSWWWWLLGLGIVAVLAAPFALGAPGPLRPLAVAAVPATAVALWWLGRIRVAVLNEELLVDDARLPVKFIAAAVPVDEAGRRDLLGASADPLAFVVQRPWIRGAVQVVLDDPADPTPYWLVSTRHPEQLAAALRPLARSGG